jgi:hypothetical protein
MSIKNGKPEWGDMAIGFAYGGIVMLIALAIEKYLNK